MFLKYGLTICSPIFIFFWFLKVYNHFEDLFIDTNVAEIETEKNSQYIRESICPVTVFYV